MIIDSSLSEFKNICHNSIYTKKYPYTVHPCYTATFWTKMHTCIFWW